VEQLTFSAVTILVILLPGFFTARVVEALTVRPSETDLDKVIEALFYSFLIYFICVAFLWINPLIVHSQQAGASAILRVDVGELRTFAIYAFILAAFFGLAISYATTNDILTRFFRFLTITRRTSRTSIWSDVFHDIDEFVVVEFTDGRRVRGWPRLFSDTPKEGSSFLERAAWILEDGSAVEINGSAILITKNLRIQSVSFIGPGMSTTNAPK